MSRILNALALTVLLAAVHALRPARAVEDTPYDIRDRIADIEHRKLELVKTLALICEARGDKEKATEYSYQAFLLDPTDEVLEAKLVDLMSKAERWPELVAIYELLIEERPGKSQGYMLELSKCHFKIGQDAEALDVLDKYKREYADYPETYLQVATTLADNGHADKAAAVLEEAIADPKFAEQYKLHWELGKVYVELGETEKAIEAYERALDRVGPGRDRNTINSRLIALYKEADRIEEVIQKREKEIDAIDAKLVKLYWAEAEKHEQAERFAEAVKFYKKVAALDPDSDKGRAAAAKVAELKPKLEQ